MMINSKIRINSDLGEGTGVEKDIMPFLSSCSIACGGHTGDKSSMTDTILIAKKYGVNIGAHPSYPDKENFGRKNISISHADLSNSLISQIDDLDRIAGSLETSLNHIKLHGALYNFSANDLETASIIIELMKLKYSDKILYVPYGSLISELAIDNNIDADKLIPGTGLCSIKDTVIYSKAIAKLKVKAIFGFVGLNFLTQHLNEMD